MASTSEVGLSEISLQGRWEAEFFQPKYLLPDVHDADWVPIGSILEKCQYGSSLPLNEEGKGFPIFRLNEIENGLLTTPQKSVVMSESEYSDLKLEIDDILFCRTNGNIDLVGRTGILKERIDACFASYLVRVRTKREIVVPEYLTVYLNSRIGRLQIKRRAMQSNQVNVSAAQLKKIPLLLPRDPLIQNRIAYLFNSHASLTITSRSLYESALKLLQDELKLNSIYLDNNIGYEARLSDVLEERRWDAQHYRPKYDALMKVIRRAPKFALLRDMLTFNQRGIQPDYVPTGPIAVVTSQRLGSQHITYDELEHTSEAAYEASYRAHIQKNDLLIYTTGAYVGRTNIFLSNIKAMASNHVNILRIKPEFDPAYVALVMNSLVGLLQTEKYATGSTQAELYPSAIARFSIPLLPPETMEAIGNKVRESYNAQIEAKVFFETAKRNIEELIESETDA